MKRPSFQFYTGDWSANPNLKRCTFAEKGIWLEVLCLMHDQPEYGVLRWPLVEIAEAVKCKPADLQALVRKSVLKGDDKQLAAAFVYTPRSGRKDGAPVTLLDTQPGPIWYSSRMVKDEYVRTIRGEGSRFGDGDGDTPKPTRKPAPKPPLGDGSSSSSSSSSSDNTPNPRKRGQGSVHDFPPGFEAFWAAYPRKDAKPSATKAFARLKPDEVLLAAMLAALHRQAATWTERRFIPHPATWLNDRRWEDGGVSGADPVDDIFARAK